jgi:hypothetical protein
MRLFKCLNYLGVSSLLGGAGLDTSIIKVGP